MTLNDCDLNTSAHAAPASRLLMTSATRAIGRHLEDWRSKQSLVTQNGGI